jgi:enoyl-CoA hydratase/carnithine racemase
MSETPHARITEDDGIITVTIERPEKLNAISGEVTETLWTATRALATRGDLRCMVITAVGRYFTAGIDLANLQHEDPALRSDADVFPGWSYRRNYRLHHLLYDEFETIEKPIVLAAQAHCLGAGVEMAASCDFRFCTPSAEWAVPEVTLGVIAGSGGSSRLTRLVGPSWGKYLAMAGMRISAERALTIGLVQDIFPAETFMDDVYAFCRKMMAFPPEALGLAKFAVDAAADVADRNVQRNIDRLANTVLVNSPEFQARIERFKGKK